MGHFFEAIIALCDARATESIGFDNVSTRIEEGPVDFYDDLGFGQAQKLVVAFEIGAVRGKALAAKICFLQHLGLYHGAHRTIDDENSLAESLFQAGAEGVVASHSDALFHIGRADSTPKKPVILADCRPCLRRISALAHTFQ